MDIQEQVLTHDVEALLNQVLMPAVQTLREDRNQLAGEFICRLRYTRAQNSTFLNRIIEQAMVWVDSYSVGTLLVPLTYWLPPPRATLALSFPLAHSSISKVSRTVVEPTLNHQHVLVCGQSQGPNSPEMQTIFMYHIASNTLVRTFSGHTDRVSSLLLSKSGQTFYSSSLDGTVRHWDLVDGRLLRTLKPHTKPILCALLTGSEDLILTGSADMTVKVSRLEGDWGTVKVLGDHSGAVASMALTAHSEFLITGSGDFMVRVWRLDNGALVGKLGSFMAPVTCLCLTSNDAFVMVACEDETLRVFSLVSGTELHELRGHEAKVISLASASNDCQVSSLCQSRLSMCSGGNG